MVHLAKKKQHGCHSKHNAYYGCTHIPKDFFERIDEISWLIGIEAELESGGKVTVRQTKEKFGTTTVYYSHDPDVELVCEGMVGSSVVWAAAKEGLIDVDEKEIPKRHGELGPAAMAALRPYVGKALPKTGRTLYELSAKKTFPATVSHQVPKAIHDARERQRRLNPALAHYIYDFAPYHCECPDDYGPCQLYQNTPEAQLKEDREYVEKLRVAAEKDKRYRLMKGGFVV